MEKLEEQIAALQAQHDVLAETQIDKAIQESMYVAIFNRTDLAADLRKEVRAQYDQEKDEGLKPDITKIVEELGLRCENGIKTGGFLLPCTRIMHFVPDLDNKIQSLCERSWIYWGMHKNWTALTAEVKAQYIKELSTCPTTDLAKIIDDLGKKCCQKDGCVELPYTKKCIGFQQYAPDSEYRGGGGYGANY